MARPITVTIPHQLGKDEARRRIADGFGQLRDQMAAGPLTLLKFQERWEGDLLLFEGGALGQTIRGHIEILTDSVILVVELPEILAALAESIKGRLSKQGQKLLEKK
jgi:hypothetical protein